MLVYEDIFWYQNVVSPSYIGTFVYEIRYAIEWQNEHE